MRARTETLREIATVTGGEMRGGEALKAYKRYAGRTAHDITGAEFRDIPAEILGEEAAPFGDRP